MEEILVNHPRFQHYDFSTITYPGRIDRCLSCQFLFNHVTNNQAQEIQAILKSDAYSKSQQTAHTIQVSNHVPPVTRSFLQAQRLSQLINQDRPSILDIGCFDGALLMELNLRLDSAKLVGFDINENLLSHIAKTQNFHFHSSGLEQISGQFDLICLSHSIQYIADIPGLFVQIKRLLKPDGVLFLQTINIEKNSWSILLGDQFCYFTPVIMKNLLARWGFKDTGTKFDQFPRDIVVLAKQTPQLGPLSDIQDKGVFRCLDDIENAKCRLNGLSKPGTLGVLGTTINAAFVDEILGETIDFFVDENRQKTNSVFRGKNVIHPEMLNASDSVIIPYGDYAPKIKMRFESRFSGEFVCF